MAAAQAAPAPPTSMEVENEAPACEGTRGWEEEIRAERDRLREQQKVRHRIAPARMHGFGFTDARAPSGVHRGHRRTATVAKAGAPLARAE